jgi:hypothetical protein
LSRAHEELVVTAVAVPELEDPDDAPEVEAPVLEDEAFLEELDFPLEPEVDFELELDDLPAVEATFTVELEPDDLTVTALAAAAFTRAGSLPVTSWIRIPPELARNVAVANATTRLRITLIRCLRALSRSATGPSAPDPAAERGVARPVTGAGPASLESTGSSFLNFRWIEMLHVDWPAPVAKP